MDQLILLLNFEALKINNQIIDCIIAVNNKEIYYELITIKVLTINEIINDAFHKLTNQS